MSYTMAKGASNKPTIYSLKNGFDKRIVERVTKKGFWILPAIVIMGLGLATLTSNQWYGKSDNKGADTSASTLSSNSSEAGNDSSGSSNAASWKNTTSTPSAIGSASSPAASSSMAGSALQTTSGVTDVIGGRGGDTTPSTSTPIPPITQPTPSTPTLPVITTPETPPIITEPAPTLPTTEPNLLCTPNLLGVLPEFCL